MSNFSEKNFAENKLVVGSLEVLNDISGKGIKQIKQTVSEVQAQSIAFNKKQEDYWSNLIDDGIISVFEKKTFKKEFDAITQTQATLYQKAADQKLENKDYIVDYVKHYNDLYEYLYTTLGLFDDMNSATAITDRVNFNKQFSDYYASEKVTTLYLSTGLIPSGELYPPYSLKALPLKDGIELSCLYPAENDLVNTIKCYTWEITKADGSVVTYTTSENSFTYVFDRKVDGYPEKEDLTGWSVRANVTNVYGEVSEWTEKTLLDLTTYGTWQITAFTTDNVTKEILDRTVIFKLNVTTPSNLTYYGNTKFRISIKRNGISAEGSTSTDLPVVTPDTDYYKPDLYSDPLATENVDKYKTDEVDGYVETDYLFTQTLPLAGQNTSNIANTVYEYKIVAYNEIVTMDALEISVTALCTSLRDIVKAHADYKNLYVEKLSAINANIGLISQGGFGDFAKQKNYWALSDLKASDTGLEKDVKAGEFRVGDDENHIQVSYDETNKAKIDFKTSTFEVTADEKTSFNKDVTFNEGIAVTGDIACGTGTVECKQLNTEEATVLGDAQIQGNTTITGDTTIGTETNQSAVKVNGSGEFTGELMSKGYKVQKQCFTQICHEYPTPDKTNYRYNLLASIEVPLSFVTVCFNFRIEIQELVHFYSFDYQLLIRYGESSIENAVLRLENWNLGDFRSYDGNPNFIQARYTVENNLLKVWIYSDTGNSLMTTYNSIRLIGKYSYTKNLKFFIGADDWTYYGNVIEYSSSEISKTSMEGEKGVNFQKDCKTDELAITGFGYSGLTYYQFDSSFQNSANEWASYIICNHGDSSSYYHQMLRLSFWSNKMQIQRMVNGALQGWKTFPLLEEDNTFQGYISAPTVIASSSLRIPIGHSSSTYTDGEIWIN